MSAWILTGMFVVLAFLCGLLIGHEWGKSAGMRIGRIVGAVDRDRELRRVLVAARKEIDKDGVAMRLISNSVVAVDFNDRERRELSSAIESNLATTEIVGKVIHS